MRYRLHNRKSSLWSCVVGCVWFLAAAIVCSLGPYLLLDAKEDHGRETRSLEKAGINSTLTNCTAHTHHSFPNSLFTPYQLSHGAFLINIAVVLYLFGMLAIVCDEYFVPALEILCERLSLSQDVAGATFMAAGTSTPELFTSIFGVFIVKGDVGLGTIIGSAVFNLLFVIGLCGIVTNMVLQLKYWAVTRECVWYLISVAALVYVMQDSYIKWYEGVLLLVLYIMYLIFMFNNARIEGFFLGEKDIVVSNGISEKAPILLRDPSVAEQQMVNSNHMSHPVGNGNYILDADKHTFQDTTPDVTLNPFHIPKGNCAVLLMWFLYIPCKIALFITIPNCKREGWSKWFPVTIVVSLIWIGVSSYILVWMANTVGITFGIPDVIMGYTILAIGNSIPDALGSILVARHGYGDMAISNSIGSNIFDILLCLGLPWFLKTVVVDPGSKVHIHNSGTLYTAVMLLGTICILLLFLWLRKFQLDKKLGGVLIVIYFLTISIGVCVDYFLFKRRVLPC